MKDGKVKVIDCTVRDGGLMNNWEFSHETVGKIYKANIEAGVDIMEMGYRVSPEIFSRKDHGVWRFCDEEELRRIITEKPEKMKISVMGDIGRVYKENFIPKKNSVIDILRLACYAHQVDEVIEISDHLNLLGYETFFNVMAVSTNPVDIVRDVLRKLNNTGATGVYLSDTFGAFHPGEIIERLGMYRELCPNLELGYHGHNNTQLALANSMKALEFGVGYIDATYYGMGRGAGNTPLELLLPVITAQKYDIGPIIEVIQSDIEPLMDKYKWGYRIPYAISGILNQHPREAIKLVSSEETRCYKRFYEESKMITV